MKRIFWLVLAIFFAFGATEAHKRHGGGHFSLFYGSLAGHGEWIDMSYGTVWRPYHTGNQWRPYMRGRWIWTDYGWYWNSYEPFGWATYHYGRWIYDDYYGWIWAPDDVWGPAWVEWRYDDDYIGWAPLPPSATFSVNVGITFGHPWVAPVHYWNFVPCGNFSSAQVVNYVQTPEMTRRIYGHTRSGGSVRTVDRRIVNDGVGPEKIERHSREKIRAAEIVERGKPGEDRLFRKNDRDRLEVYRPDPEELRKEGATRESRKEGVCPRPAPRNAQQSLEEVKRGRTGQRTPETTGPRSGQESARKRDDSRNGTGRELYRERPEIELKRPGTGRENPGTGAVRPDIQRDRPEIKLQRPEVKRESPDIKVQRPEVKREKPAVRRDKPDGRSAQPGRPAGRGPGN